MSVLFTPKRCMPFLQETIPAAGVVIYDGQLPAVDPDVDWVINSGRFTHRNSQMASVDGASSYGNSRREFFPDQIFGNQSTFPQPPPAPVAWGSFMYGLYDMLDDGIDNRPGPIYEPVIVGDYVQFEPEPDLQQFYYVEPTDYAMAGNQGDGGL